MVGAPDDVRNLGQNIGWLLHLHLYRTNSIILLALLLYYY